MFRRHARPQTPLTSGTTESGDNASARPAEADAPEPLYMAEYAHLGGWGWGLAEWGYSLAWLAMSRSHIQHLEERSDEN
jgi:hypothetical protein